MTLDTTLSIAALALCIGQVAAASRPNRRTTIRVGLPLEAAAAIAISLLNGRVETNNHLRQLVIARRDIVSHTKTPATFDDIYSKIYYISYDLVNEAIDDIVSDETLTSSEVMLTDAQGSPHTVRLFSTHS